MATIVAVAALVAFVNAVVIPEAGSWFLDAVVKMPRFDYRFQNGEQGNDNWIMYRNLRSVSFMILAVALTYSAVVLVGEEFEVFRKGEAFSMLSKGLLIIVFIFTFPPIWDLYASGMEGLARYVLNPSNPNQAGQKVSTLIQMIGGITPPELDWTTIINGLTDPNSFQGFFRDVFLAVFKAFIAALLMFLMFVIGTVRIVLTGVLVIALPIILALSIVPYLGRVMERLKDILIGLSLAPLLSALAVSAGLALINSTNFSPLQEWLAAIAVALLAVTFPVITAPVLGSLVSSASTIFTGGMLAGTLFGGSAVIGGVTGAYRGVQAAVQTGVISPLGIAKHALTGAGSGLYRGLQLGTIHSAAEGVRSMGFARLAEPLHRAEQIAVRRLREAGLDTAEGITSNFTGSVTEGLLPALVLNTPVAESRIPGAIEEAVKFNARVQELARKGRYEEIADVANEYLKFSSIPNRKVFGQLFAEQLQAYSKNPVALAKLHEGLKHVREEGGITAQNPDTLAALIHFRDPLRNLVSEKYGIAVPDSEFELSDVRKPEELPAGAAVVAAYPVKYSIANALEYAEEMKRAAPEKLLKWKARGEELIGEPDKLKLTVLKRVNDILGKRYGVDTSNENVRLFMESLATKITQDLLARDPESLGTVAYVLNRNEIFYDLIADMPARGLHAKADQLLPNVHIQKLWREAKSAGNDNSSSSAAGTESNV